MNWIWKGDFLLENLGEYPGWRSWVNQRNFDEFMCLYTHLHTPTRLFFSYYFPFRKLFSSKTSHSSPLTLNFWSKEPFSDSTSITTQFKIELPWLASLLLCFFFRAFIISHYFYFYLLLIYCLLSHCGNVGMTLCFLFSSVLPKPRRDLAHGRCSGTV